ncbi:MAG: LysM peptidoglycan-binding domain-containing protein [Candidatus Saccharibacteria bacterium]|nr:LysM peptidoglycan-binding domain-containing protein [Candidatus Saccharibacteria bacterium]
MREERRGGSGCQAVTQGHGSTIIRNQKVARRGKKANLRAVLAYGGLFIAIMTLLTVSHREQSVSSKESPVAAATTTTASGPVAAKVSVDQLAAVNAATNLAEAANLPSAGELREATTTLAIKKELAQTDAEVISKPQIIQPETSSRRGLTSYVTKQGDTLETVARRFGISTQTLRWANNTTSDAVEAGKTLTVPTVDGVVYTVKQGDTVESIATKYKVDAERVVLFNDLDRTAALAKDTRLVLPNGELPENERPGYVAPRAQRSYRSNNSSYSAIRSSYARASVGNRYAPGNCTWYSYERRLALGRPIGSFWGNANSWAASARAAGFTVNRTPVPGAIFQTAAGGGGYGHVGIVERVENGRVFVSDMNYGGYGVVTHRELTNPGAYNYIH